MHYNDKIDLLADLIKNNDRNFALTGAGISTESGIADFRSPGTGLWTKIDPVKAASLSSLRREPAEFYRININHWAEYRDCEPNDAHTALAELERTDLLVGVITQNIDGLHLKAGSKRVWEVHGHLRTCHCQGCRRGYPFDSLLEQLEAGKNPPLCEKCGSILRPDIVLFEDSMSNDFFNAMKALTGCQLLLVVGSSLQVYPVAGMPDLARHVVIINREPTPWDDRAALVIHGSAGQVFRDLLVKLGE